MRLLAFLQNRFDPIARKRWRRFLKMKRASLSLFLLTVLYVASWFSELIANGNPLYLRFEGRSYFPVLVFYPEDTFLKNGVMTRPNYRAIVRRPAFQNNSKNWAVFAPIPYGPNEIMNREDVTFQDWVTVHLSPEPQFGTVNIRADYTVARSRNFTFFAPGKARRNWLLTDIWNLPGTVRAAIRTRFENKAAPRLETRIQSRTGKKTAQLSLSTYRVRTHPPRSIRLTFREVFPGSTGTLVFNQAAVVVKEANAPQWQSASAAERTVLTTLVRQRYQKVIDEQTIKLNGRNWRARFSRTDFRFPFRPTSGHPLGLDSAGRDVLARLIYGMRTSMTFAVCLVLCSMSLGTLVGAWQGYHAGIRDLTAQRLIEIWSSLPFLYIMILMGSIYGRSLWLLLFCYAIFNWIGISYYIRMEFLRLRKQPFVEAAVCLGLPPWRIIFRHILPNALVPVITFFPFSLVGAIGVLTALDYLGFGLPPPTPSWGALLAQAQEYSWAWWLVVYPSLILFTVMLLGVFIGEGVRAAYDPKRFSRME